MKQADHVGKLEPLALHDPLQLIKSQASIAKHTDILKNLLDADAEAKGKNTAKFISMFADGGYFYDVSAGKKYYGQEIGAPVDAYAAAFPDMHRELFQF